MKTIDCVELHRSIEILTIVKAFQIEASSAKETDILIYWPMVV